MVGKKMKILLVILSFFILLSLVPAQTPSQTPADIVLQHREHAVQKVDLTSIDPVASKLIDKQNPELQAFKPMTMPNLGRLSSDAVLKINQSINDIQDTIPLSIQDLRQREEPKNITYNKTTSKSNLPLLNLNESEKIGQVAGRIYL
jgi:hypothetical protein